MKHGPLILLVALTVIPPAVAKSDENRIELSSDASRELRDTAEQLAKWLTLATNQEFTLGKGSILLRRASPDDRELIDRKLEAFRIFGTGDRLVIVGNSDQAIRHGVYFYLEKLGFRWLFPSEKWTIVPKLKTHQFTIDEVHEPAFRLRNFFGTGGFGGKLPVDPEMKLQARWERWKEQNRFGGDVQLAGHAGEAFNHAHRKTLEANAEFFAELDGKRQPWGVTTKLCTSNAEVRKLWIADRLKKLEFDSKQFPGSPRSTSVSVEPADGVGHCECKNCQAIGTVSDRVFDLANHTARAVAAKHPGKLVNLYAYNLHAAPPKFRLEPNVMVLVAPYAFQRTGLPGDELVKAWSPRANHFGVYDYWAIPDWANCQPMFGVEAAARKIRFWHKQGATAFLGESSFSAGNVGLTWYVASRLMWDPKADEQAIVDEFFELAFGAASGPMRRMHERWADGFLLSEHELALTFRDLAEARRLTTNDSSLRARVEDFVLYAQYLRLWKRYWESDRGSDDRIQRADELLHFLWRIYPTAIVHSFRMYQLVTLRHERGNDTLLKKWPQKDAMAAAWQPKNLLPPTGDETNRMLERGVEDFTPLEFEKGKFSGQLVPLHRPETLSKETVQTPFFAGTHDFEFWARAESKQVTLQIRCNQRDNYPGNLIVVTRPDGAEVFRHTAPSDGEWHEIEIPISKTGNFQMTIHDQKIFFAIIVPKNLPFVVKGWKASPALPARVFFSIPSGISRLAISQQSVVPLKISDANDREVLQSDAKMFVVKVPEKSAGEIWSISNFKTYTPLRLLNAPNVFSFSREGMMVDSKSDR